MGVFFQIAAIALVTAATLSVTGQRLRIATPDTPSPARQIAHNMQIYHEYATKGALPPAYFTDNRFNSCNDGTSVATSLIGVNNILAMAVAAEVERQYLFPPAQNTFSGFPASYGTAVTTAQAVTQFVGVAQAAAGAGQSVDTGYGSRPMPAGCVVAAGSIVILTRVK